MATDGHWVRWHDEYQDPASSLSRRLAAVQRRLRAALDAAPSGPIRVLNVCAGQARDLLPVLAVHPRRFDVRALLVELDPNLAREARAQARRAGLDQVEVREGDASITGAYAEMVPAHIVLLCGIFGNISRTDIRRTIRELRHLCAPTATIIWTRHRRPPDLSTLIRSWFAASGFEEVGFDTEEGWSFGVGTHRMAGAPLEYRSGRTMFSFVGSGADAHF